jgi:two-component system chemotaxis response regulator CheY
MVNHKPIVLIVDDSTTMRRMIRRVIEMTGIPVGEIMEAADGRAALAIMASEPVKLVLADLNMPVMDGFEMIRQMRRSDSLCSIPVIVISAQPNTDQIEQLRRDGVTGYLPKPFTAEDVRDLIGPLLASARPKDAPHGPGSAAFNLNLAEALAEALETMAFISLEMQDDSAAPASARVVRIAFHGAGGVGCLTLAAPPELGALVASNCNSGPAEGDDALKELANITCGILLRKRVGGSAGFEMSPPILAPETDADSIWDGDVVRFNADGHPIAAQVTSDWGMFECQEE